MENKERPTGFYWVRPSALNDWEPCQYISYRGVWDFHGEEEIDDYFHAIGKRIVHPSEIEQPPVRSAEEVLIQVSGISKDALKVDVHTREKPIHVFNSEQVIQFMETYADQFRSKQQSDSK